MESSSFWNPSNIIGILGLFLAAIAIVVSLWIYFKQKNKKRLEYKVIANEDLLSYHEDLEKELVILYKDRKIDNLALLILEFENTGNIPIQRSDFDSSLEIKFKTSTYIFGIEILNTYPENLNLEMIREIDSIAISPFLINPKDKFSLKILYNNKDFDYEINARIVGIKEISELKEKDKRILILRNVSILLAIQLLTLYFLLGAVDLELSFLLLALNLTITILIIRNPFRLNSNGNL